MKCFVKCSFLGHTCVNTFSSLPYSHSSHYQVIAILLQKGSSLLLNGLSDPDVDYPTLASLQHFSYADTDNCPNPELGQQIAYITAEFDDNLFPENGYYIVGDRSQPNDQLQYNNGPLCYGATYTFFIRAYVERSGSGKRHVSQRNYQLFSSSKYTTTITTATGNK